MMCQVPGLSRSSRAPGRVVPGIPEFLLLSVLSLRSSLGTLHSAGTLLPATQLSARPTHSLIPFPSFHPSSVFFLKHIPNHFTALVLNFRLWPPTLFPICPDPSA